MARYYDKEELKRQLEIEQIFDLLELWGGEPEYTSTGIVSQTICHNAPGDGSRKLYYYENDGVGLFHCYTSCGSIDVFELCIRVMEIQKGLEWTLYDAMDYIASYFGIDGIEMADGKEAELSDWEVFKKHTYSQTPRLEKVRLPEFDSTILSRFAYPRISSWEREGISPTVSRENLIGYYPGKEQITIPHFDEDGRLIGIRGRALIEDEADRYGKYRPLKVGKTLYNHPLSMNLYHLDKTKDNIKRAKIALIFESEKSCLMYESYYGNENDLSVSCCGQNLSSYQVYLLQSLGVNEIIICLDRDFTEIGDENFKRVKSKLMGMYKKYGNKMRVSAVFDKNFLLPLHASPIDAGPQIFEQLLRERIIPKAG